MLFISFSNLFIETFSAENEDMRSFLKGVGWWHNHNIMILEGRTPGTLRPWLHIHSLKKLFFFAKKRDDFYYLQRQLFHWQIVINDDTVVCNYSASWRKLRLSVSVELFVICVFNSCPSRPAGDCLIGVFTVYPSCLVQEFGETIKYVNVTEKFIKEVCWHQLSGFVPSQLCRYGALALF